MQNGDVLASTNIGMYSTTETVIRVLCVDDESNLLQTTKSILELQTSFEIETASSVDEALQKIAQKEFDVIVSDYQMPIKSGLDFLKQLRDSGNDIPFILFTGKGREEVAVKALNLGADRYFNKIGHPETVYGELAHGITQLANKKRVEREAKRLSSVIEQSSNAIVILDRQEKIVYVNPAFLQFHGARFEDLIGTSWQPLIAEGTPIKEESEEIRNTVFKEKGVWSKEIFNTLNGVSYWRKVKIFPLVDENGKVTHVVYNGEDITEQKRSEQTIWDREERLRAIIGSSPDSMIVTDMHGIVTDCNIQTLKLLEVSSRKELIGEDCYQFISKDDLENVRLKLPNLLEEGSVKNVECKLLKNDGTKIDVEFSANTLMDAFGDPVGAVILTRDITERKKVEDAIKESEEKYRNIVELSPDGIVTMNMQGIITSANKAAREMTGLSKDEIVGRHFTKMGIFRLRDLPKYVKLVSSMFRGKINHRTEFVYLRKDGTERFGDAYISILGENGKKLGLQAILRDITEEKKIQEALKDSEEKYRNIVEMSPDGMISIDSNGIVTAVNRSILTQTGFDKADFVGKHFSQLEAVPEEELSELSKKIKSFLSGDIPESFELCYSCKDGKRLCAEATVGLLKHNNKDAGIQLLFRDITERKKTEQEHRESERRFKELAELLPEVIFEYDLNGKLTYVNHEAYTKFGYSKKEFDEGINVFEMIAPEFRETAQKSFERVLNGEKPGYIEFKMIRKDGTTFPSIITSVLIIQDNKIVGIRGLLVDITEQQKTVEALASEKKLLKGIMENIDVMIAYLDPDFNFLAINPAYAIGSGYKVEEMIGKNHFELFPNEENQRIFEKVRDTGKALSFFDKPFEYANQAERGVTYWNWSLTPIINDERKTEGLVLSLTETTQRKHIEQQLKDSEERYHTQFEENLDAIFLADPDTGIIIDCNRAATHLFGKTKSELIGKHQQILHPPQETVTNFSRTFIDHSKNKEGEALESKIVTKNAEIRDVIIKGNVIKLGKRKVVQGIFRDVTEHKKAQDNLIKERDTLEKVTGNLSAALVMISKDCRIQWTNDYLNRRLGDVTGELCHFALNRLDHICSGCKIQEVIETGKQAVFEISVHNPKGQNLPEDQDMILEITAIPIKDKNGNVTEILELAMDITERKIMEDAIREAEEKYKVLIESANVMIISVDGQGKYNYVNNEWKRLFGYSDEEIKQITIMDTVHSDHKNNCLKDVELVAMGTAVNGIETVFVTKDGKEIHARGNARPIINNGKVISTVGVFLDVTEHQKAQEELKESEKRFRELSELLPEVVFESNSKGILTFVNHAAYNQFRYTKEEFEKGLTPIQFIAPQDRERAKKNLATLMSGKEPGPNEYLAIRKDGTTFPVTVKSTPIIHKGKIEGIRGIMVDLTKHMKTQDTLKKTLTNLETLNEKLGVVGKISRHDVKNKLSIILNNAFLMRYQLDQKKAGALKHLEDIETAVEQIEKILDFARIYEMLGTQEKITIDVKTILEEAFMLVSQSYELELVNECENLTVQADSLLRQVFYNLMENSAKHGEKTTQIKVNYTNEKNVLKIIYSDNGIGIPENEKEKIFQEGYGKGTGYGLYLIRKICDEYGWTITEEGKSGKGAKFVIRIAR